MLAHRLSVAAVWVATLVAAVVAAAVVRGPVVAAVLTLVLAIAVVASIPVQLAGAEREGFVERLAASVCGAFAVVVVTALVLLAASTART